MTIKFIVKSDSKCAYCHEWLYGKIYSDWTSMCGTNCCWGCKKKYGEQVGVCGCGVKTSRWCGFDCKNKKNKWWCFDCYKISVGGSSGGGGGMAHNTFGLRKR